MMDQFGNFSRNKPKLRPPLIRFMAHIEKTESCWLWTAGLQKSGYGGFSIDRVSISAHRASWILLKGEIPAGMIVCHKCDVRNCVNPDHLFLGTHKDNAQDMIKKGRKFVASDARAGCSILTDDKVRELRRLRAAGATYVELAKRFDMHPVAASQAGRGLTWKHITDVPPIPTQVGKTFPSVAKF